MRVFALPIVVLGMIATDQPATFEPNEGAMRAAFETTLRRDVQNAIDFMVETDGPEALARVRDAGTDRFEVQSFRKLKCGRDELGYVCDFAVDVSVVSGTIQQTITGRFKPVVGGFSFSQES